MAQPDFKQLIRVRNPHSQFIEELVNNEQVRLRNSSTVPYFLKQRHRLDRLCGIVPVGYNSAVLYRKKTPRIIARFQKYTWFE